MKKIVVIGGGTGTYTVLKGLKEIPDFEISAIVTMADDGGSNKILRDEFGLLPTSGVRQCIVALSENEGLLRELFIYRYYQGVGISGMTFGNLFMAATADILGSQKQAIEETCKILGVAGRVLPVSYDKVSLLAKYSDGTELLGEHMIDEAGKQVGKARIVNFRTVPKTVIDDDACRAILEADLLVLGPGDLYTNTIANLVVGGVAEAIRESKGKLVLVMNLMTKLGETAGYRASDFVTDVNKYLDSERIDYVIVNSDVSIHRNMLIKYQKEGAELVGDDLDKSQITNNKLQIIRGKLLSHVKQEVERGDKMVRSMVRHDSAKLAKAIVSLL